MDCRAEIASDFSAIHQEKDPLRLPSSRYFEFAELLPCYQGAVRVALTRLASVEQPTEPEPVAEVSPATLAALSDHPGFPGIEFT